MADDKETTTQCPRAAREQAISRLNSRCKTRGPWSTGCSCKTGGPTGSSQASRGAADSAKQ